MAAIVDFLMGIGQAIVALVNFVVDFVADIIWFAQLLMDLLPALPAFFTWLPASISGVLYTCFGVVVVLRVIGLGD